MSSHYEQLPVYQAIYQLTLAVQRDCMPHLSRDVRYTLGQGLVRLLMNMLVTVYEANLTRDKHALLLRARKMTVEAKVTLRMLCDMRQMSARLYLVLAQQAESVSKQLTAWDNNTMRQQKQAPNKETE